MDSLAFFDFLKQNNAISEVWQYILVMLKDKYDVSDDTLKLFCLFFSLIDDGNICISLNPKILKKKWQAKLYGIETSSDIDYDSIIDKGIADIKELSSDEENSLILEFNDKKNVSGNYMFVIHKNWLFTEKFFDAKRNIEKSMEQLFPIISDAGVCEQDIEDIQKKYKNLANLDLSKEQAEAIVRAIRGQNLIITGGPGTGKTTVICYLLLELLSLNENHKIYMAAPSGKAAKRMKESLSGSLNKLKENSSIVEMITNVQPLTIHKLLGLSGINSYETTKFPANSIFVIDEASMIDVALFAKLLNVIKQSDGVRVFILGDKDQIPSVQPGAVFTDLTDKRRDSLIELIQTHRFIEGSEIYKLKQGIQSKDFSVVPDNWSPISKEWENELLAQQEQLKTDTKNYPVKYLTMSTLNEAQLAVTGWYNVFYNNEKYNKVYSELDLSSSEISETLDAIWSYIEKAKILCAENQGMRGTEKINKMICEHIKTNFLQQSETDNFFVGEQIIVTKNQPFYDLSNGDIGIIVSLDNKKYMMIKRADLVRQENGSDYGIIRYSGNYLFYPLYLLPSDSIEPAYAITIHKSQGSEYDNILIFLPESEHSPLLNRQILYTAITRTKHTTYIVSNQENMKNAINTSCERDTQLFL